LCGRGHGTADGWVAARGVLVDAKSCGDHAGVNAGESGVWVDGNIVKDPGERLLVYDQCLDVSHRDLMLLNEVFALLPDERYGVRREQDVLGVLGEERDLCLDGFVGVGQDLQAVLGVLVCAGGGSVVPRHPEARGLGDTRQTGGVRTLDGPAALSAERGRRRSGGRPRRATWGELLMGMSVDGWLC
jgi:hypothetical protein